MFTDCEKIALGTNGGEVRDLWLESTCEFGSGINDVDAEADDAIFEVVVVARDARLVRVKSDTQQRV
jgi:hypothetical protein